jgi:hypothetical protein
MAALDPGPARALTPPPPPPPAPQAYAGQFRDNLETSLYVLLYEENDVPLRSPNIAARPDDLLSKAGASALLPRLRAAHAFPTERASERHGIAP